MTFFVHLYLQTACAIISLSPIYILFTTSIQVLVTVLSTMRISLSLKTFQNDQMCNWSHDVSDTFLCFLRNSFSLFVACSFFHFLLCERIDTSIQIQSKLCKTELCIQFYNCKSFQHLLNVKFLNKIKNQMTSKSREFRN